MSTVCSVVTKLSFGISLFININEYKQINDVKNKQCGQILFIFGCFASVVLCVMNRSNFYHSGLGLCDM